MNKELEHLDNPWRLGLPPRKADLGKYEIYLSPIGVKWYRKKLTSTTTN